MGYKYTGEQVMNISLSVNTNKPLDTRTVVDNIQQLYEIPPETAYQGMTVANVANGNIYMLVGDQRNPSNAIDPKNQQHWKASYESIQIVTCTQEEYLEWESNTNNYVAIDPNKPYLREDVYYYIYENTMKRSDTNLDENGNYPEVEDLEKQAYVSFSQLDELNQIVVLKANRSDLVTLETTIGNKIKDTLKEYTKSSDLEEYVKKDDLSTSISTDYYNKTEIDNKNFVQKSTLNDYYDITESDNKFVSYDWLKSTEGTEEEYRFVETKTYEEKIAEITSELENTLKSDGAENNITNLSVNNLTIKDSIDTSNSNKPLNINASKIIVNRSQEEHLEVPFIETLEANVYEQMSKSGNLKNDVYYCVFSDDQKDGVITKEILEAGYYSKYKVNQLISEAIYPLLQRIAILEGRSAILDKGILNEMTLG